MTAKNFKWVAAKDELPIEYDWVFVLTVYQEMSGHVVAQIARQIAGKWDFFGTNFPCITCINGPLAGDAVGPIDINSIDFWMEIPWDVQELFEE